MPGDREIGGDDAYFDPREFWELKMEQLKSDSWREKYDFWFSCLHNFLTTEEFTGDRLLELASGPTVYNIALPAFYFSNITVSDNVERNCDEISKWLRKDPEYLDWTLFFRRAAIAAKRENIEEACKEMENRVQSSIKNIIYCDVLNQMIIPRAADQEPFDLILSCLTLENSMDYVDSYFDTLGSIKRLLKKGGKLVMMSLLKNTGYIMGRYRSPALSLDKQQINTILMQNSYVNIKWEVLEQSEDQDIAYFVSATKP